ncbi:LysR family transcriptional regulator [Novosphingobium profundi]|uniref:LysR family transcriptional regulator n=1 Tax=Novosphingobium profundi TaxID=1774954 RepID=UPI001BD9B9D3|nr:LysR family transcriptional regulator [Novosphingobium profundi]MBT0670216.1 LysR family transcriptional regulator [Novosphingobium profundi]
MDSYSLSTIFLMCADSGSFAAAGRRLNLSRSAVGKAIAKLEDDLGVRLFHRTTRHQGLTEDGHIYLEHARRAQNELEAVREVFASGRRSPTGILRAALPAALGRHFIGPLLLQLPGLHPEMHVALSLSDQPIDLLESGFDLAVRIGASLDSDGILRRKIGTQAMSLYAGPSYLERFGTPSNPADLDHHHMVVYSRGRTLHWQTPHTKGKAGPEGTARLQVDDLDLLADTAVQGLGIVSLPQWLAAPHVATGALQRLSVLAPRSFDIAVLWPQSDIVPLRTRVAIDHLAAHLPAAMALAAQPENTVTTQRL